MKKKEENGILFIKFWENLLFVFNNNVSVFNNKIKLLYLYICHIGLYLKPKNAVAIIRKKIIVPITQTPILGDR